MGVRQPRRLPDEARDGTGLEVGPFRRIQPKAEILCALQGYPDIGGIFWL